MLLRNLIASVILASCCFGFVGCWDHNEVEDISVVVGVLVDKAPDDKVTLMVQVLNPGVLAGGAGGNGGDGNNALPWRDYAASADTLFLAGREVARQASPKLFFDQNQVIVISERMVADVGLAKIIDYFERNPQFRRTNWVVVYRGEDPRKLFEDPSILQRTPVRRIAVAAQESTQISSFAAVRLGELLNMIAAEGMQPTLGGVNIVPSKAYVKTDTKDVLGVATEKHNMLLDGNGVFKNSKLVGWLEALDNKGFLWIVDKMKGGVMEITPGEGNGKVVLEIIRSHTKLKPRVCDGSIAMHLKIDTLTQIVDSEVDQDYSKSDVIAKLSRAAEERIKEDIIQTLDKVQGEYRSDIFGFGRALSKEYPNVWKQVRDNWDDDTFPFVEVELQVGVTIRASGLVGKGVQFR